MKIEINGLTEAQEIALKDFLAQWVFLGHTGMSRWTAFFADGDGNFHPEIKVDGETPIASDLYCLEDLWRKFQFCDCPEDSRKALFIDFDYYAVKMRQMNENKE